MPTRVEMAAVGALRQAGPHQCAPGDSQRMRGVTLIELLIVIVVVAILSSIAVANYRQYVLRSNRTDATGALLRIQVAEEKFFLQNSTYTTNAAAAPPTGLGVASPTSNGFYTLAVTADPNSTNNIATSFLATATAVGSQTKDTSCLTLTINDQGQHNSSPSASSTCWH